MALSASKKASALKEHCQIWMARALSMPSKLLRSNKENLKLRETLKSSRDRCRSSTSMSRISLLMQQMQNFKNTSSSMALLRAVKSWEPRSQIPLRLSYLPLSVLALWVSLLLKEQPKLDWSQRIYLFKERSSMLPSLRLGKSEKLTWLRHKIRKTWKSTREQSSKVLTTSNRLSFSISIKVPTARHKE